MNIIFSNYDDMHNPYYGGGGALAIHEVAKRLSKNHTVRVITGRYPGSKDEVVDGVAYKRIGLHFFDARVGQLIFYFCLPWYAFTLKFDAWLESFTPPFSAALLPLFTKKPVIGITHLLGGVAMKEKYGLPFHFVEKLFMKAYRNVIVMQEELAKQVHDMSANSNTYIIPNGVSDNYINYLVGPKENYIAFLGRIDLEQKGLDLLLRAYALEKNKIGMKVKIAGNGLEGDVDKVKQLIKRLGLEDSVELLGRLSGKVKEQYLSGADIFVMPSRAENFALVLLEAFCFELPVIAFNIPGVQWSPDACVIKVPCFDVAEFGRTLTELAHNEQQRRAMGQIAKEYVKQYTWDSVAQQYEEVINKIVEIA